jgi:hypothetical protein
MLYHMSRGYTQNYNKHKVRELQNGVVEYEIYNVLHKIYPTGRCYWFSVNNRDEMLGMHFLSEYEGAVH